MGFSRRSHLFLILAGLLALTSCRSAPLGGEKTTPPPATSNLPISWLQLGPSSTLIARTVTVAATCPALELTTAAGTSRSLPMTERGAASAAFPARVCEMVVPAGVVSARIGQEKLPVPSGKIERVYAIGDTGCRAKVSHGYPSIQDCLDPVAWPFGEIASGVAAQKPDLVVHVGDYLYRELDVPGQPFGDRLETWIADFLLPARPLLRAAPWVFVRGNHEGCGRGAEGWRRLLDPRAYGTDCNPAEDPYWATLGGFSVAVVDSSSATDDKSDPDRVATFTRQLTAVEHFPVKNAWLATHKPLWNAAQPKGDLLKATKGRSFRNFAGVLAGHAHFFAALLFESLPAEFITGNGGSTLTPTPTSVFDEVSAGGRRIRHAIFQGHFGYLELRAKARSPWRVIEHNVLGEAQLTCDLKGAVACNIPRRPASITAAEAAGSSTRRGR